MQICVNSKFLNFLISNNIYKNIYYSFINELLIKIWSAKSNQAAIVANQVTLIEQQQI